MSWPQRIESGADALDFTSHGALTFEQPDRSRFPGLFLAWRRWPPCPAPRRAQRRQRGRGGGLPRGRLRFDQIHQVNRATLEHCRPRGRTAWTTCWRSTPGPGTGGRARALPLSSGPAGHAKPRSPFVFALALLIAVHEWGHYRMARAQASRVLRFSIGLPAAAEPDRPRRHRIRVLPRCRWRATCMPRRARGEVDPRERHLAFNTQSLRKRAAIVAAGPLANLALAVLLYAAVSWIGLPQARPLSQYSPARWPSGQAWPAACWCSGCPRRGRGGPGPVGSLSNCAGS